MAINWRDLWISLGLMFVFSFILCLVLPEPRWLRLTLSLATGVFWTFITGLNPFPIGDEDGLD